MTVRHELTRLGVGSVVYLLQMICASMVYQKPYLSFVYTLQMACVTIMASGGCLFLYFCLSKYTPNWSNSQYKPPFTMYYISLHVYGLGFLTFVVCYCTMNTSMYCSMLFLVCLLGTHLDDMIERGNKNPWGYWFWKTLAGVFGVVSIFVGGLSTWEDTMLDILAITDWIHFSWFKLVFFVCLPLLTQLIFCCFRGSQYCTHLQDAVWDLIQFGIPFACVISFLMLLCTSTCLFHNIEPLSPIPIRNITHIPDNFDSVWWVLFLPVTNLGVLMYTLFCVLNYGSIDVVFSLSLAMWCKFMYLHAETEYAMLVMMGGICMILCRSVYMYIIRKDELRPNVRLPQSDENLDQVFNESATV